MMKILFIGSSKIIEEHIKAALKLKLKLYSLNSTKTNSENQKKIYKKYVFEKKFNTWKSAVKDAGNKKNIFFFVVSRTSDTENILKFCSQYKNKIFVEKPITFKKKIYIKNYKNIFVGYNRIYFNVLNKIKKIKLRNFYCNVNMSYNNFNEIKQNISHIFSCLLFLFGNLTLVKKIKNKTNKTFIFKNDANNYIFLNLLNTNADNYSINIITNKINFLFKPLEFLFIYKSIEFKFYLNNPKKMYTRQKLLKRFNEFKYNNFKPGFLNQMNAFKKFCRNKKKIINNIDFANKVLTWSWKILRF